MCVFECNNNLLYIFYNEFYSYSCYWSSLTTSRHKHTRNANNESIKLAFPILVTMSRLALNLSARISNMKPDA